MATKTYCDICGDNIYGKQFNFCIWETGTENDHFNRKLRKAILDIDLCVGCSGLVKETIAKAKQEKMKAAKG